jgi:lysozyme family protein
MASFVPAFAALDRDEGKYSNRKEDSGGETYRGISRVHWPLWEGWERIDEWKKNGRFPANLETDDELQRMVAAFYRQEFWWPALDRVQSQSLANKLMSFAVVAGKVPAVKALQFGIRACSGQRLEPDGMLGPKTEAAIRACDSAQLLVALRCEMACHFRMVAQRRPKDLANLAGWLNRAYL